MNEKQRVKKVIKFEQVDKIPWQINYTTEIAEKIMQALKIERLNYTVLDRNIFAYNNLDDFFGNHIAYLRNRAVDSVKEVKPGIWEDEWGVLWDRRIDKDVGNPINCILEDSELKTLKVPDPNDPERYAHFNPIIEANSNRYLLVKFTYSLFERAWSLRGMENLMIDFIKNPLFVKELFEIITDFNIKIIKNLRNFPIDGIFFGDDWGGQEGLLISPKTWQEFIKPYIRKMYAQAHLQGYDVFIHSCGDISILLDDLIKIGVDVFNPFQPEVMHIEDIMRRYFHKLAFYGGLSIQKTLPFGRPGKVQKEVEHRLHLAHKYNGLIISPSHDLTPDIPLKNILAMHERIKLQ